MLDRLMIDRVLDSSGKTLEIPIMPREYQLKNTKTHVTSSIDYAAVLNEQQYAAVTSDPGPALVIAGAGSGKTHTLTYRVAYLLDKGVEPSNILLLTFTNKASREMLERVGKIIDGDVSALWGGTFHSVCNRILRRHADDIGYTRQFSILDGDDQKSMMRQLVKAANLSTKDKRFPKAEVLLSIFSLSVNTEESVEDLLETRYPHLDEWKKEILKLSEEYRVKKLESNSMDFDDLLTKALYLLEQHDDLAKLYQKKFRHVLVDEYQDTNIVQGKLVDIFVLGNKSLMVVGDDAQSIYSWRGANMDHILDFPKKYEGAKVFKIETNYRSRPEILDFSNAAIAVNRKQFQKTLLSVRENGMVPALVPLGSPSEQSDFITQRITEAHEQGIELSDIAVLYRAHYQSMEIQMELTRGGLPFQLTSGLRFFEQAHIKDVTSFVRFMVNPRDEVCFIRMVSLLPGVGEKSAHNLWRAWMTTAGYLKGEVSQSITKDLLGFKVPAKAKKYWEQLCYTLDELSTSQGFAKPSDMIFSVMEGVYIEYMEGAFENYEHRKQDIETLTDHASSYSDVEEFLAELSLLSAVDDSDKKNDEPQVTLSTIHQAKGLEWKMVFVVWLCEGMFPSTRVLESGDEDQLEEERRLFYVAVTRAMDELYLTYPMMNPKSYSGDYCLEPSRFLEDCPPEMMEEWNVSSW